MAPNPRSQVDTPWSWVILACSFSCYFCFSLLSSSTGLIQVEMIEDLQFGSGAISVVSACAVGLGTLLGPVSGVIASILSMRMTVILGTILMSVGMLCTSFSHTMPELLFFYALLTGVGHGIASSPCIVIIQQVFKKRRLLANGIMSSSSSFGLLCLPYLHQYIIEEYGWRFCIALQAGLILHVIVFASFFQPTEIEKATMVKISSCLSREGDASKNGSECDENEIGDEDQRECNEKDHNDDNTKCGKKPEEMLFLSKESVHAKKLEMLINSTNSISLSSKNLSVNGPSRPYIPVYINGTPKLRSPVTELIVAHSPSFRHSLHSDDGDAPSRFMLDRSISQVSSVSAISINTENPGTSITAPSTPTTTKANKHLLPIEFNPRKFGQLRKNTIGSRSYLGSSLAFASSDLGSSIMLPVTAIEEIRAGDEEEFDFEEESMKTKIKRVSSNKQLWLFCVNALFLMNGCGTHSIHLASYVTSKGIPSNNIANFYLAFGTTITIGRLIGGATYNKLKPPLVPLVIVLQIMDGLFVLLAPIYATNLTGVFIMEIGIGLTYGQAFMMQAPIVAQMVRIQDMAIAIGFVQLFNGLGYIASPIVAGFLYDITGTFDIPFHISGAIVVSGSFILLLMQYLSYKEQQGSCKDEEVKTTETKEDENVKTKGLLDNGDDNNV